VQFETQIVIPATMTETYNQITVTRNIDGKMVTGAENVTSQPVTNNLDTHPLHINLSVIHQSINQSNLPPIHPLSMSIHPPTHLSIDLSQINNSQYCKSNLIQMDTVGLSFTETSHVPKQHKL